MKTIQIVVDEKLLRAADREARQSKRNRSQLFREAMQEYLRRRKIREMEERDRAGYEKTPQSEEEVAPWEAIQAWPED